MPLPDPVPRLIHPLPTSASQARSKPILPTDLRQLRVDEFLQARSLNPHSRRAYRQDLQCFLDWTPIAWVDLTPRLIAQYKTYLLRINGETGERYYSDATVVRKLGTLKTFFGWLVNCRYIEFDPTLEVQVPKLPEPKADNLSDELVSQLYTWAATSSLPERNIALLSVLGQGLRASSVSRLDLQDYDGKRLTVEHDKRDTSRSVPLYPHTQTHLNNYLEWRSHQGEALQPDRPLFLSHSRRNAGDRLSYAGIHSVMQAIERDTGIKVHAHQLRHTFGTNLVAQRLNPYHVKTIMGIKSDAVLHRYTQAAEAQAAETEFWELACKQQPPTE
ncbi:tyrosine-type recombinase/integrase [Microcoleus sp. FACHB-1515]|uniref:tyrosine-type recombinase/integrase n=1 Tax=Cyanophyceae TaxID=3028117 RepID=UPI001689CA71|nr:tyrosine-type recombinase/integrase [Microcoleus sp. FACHB-1515]MBD2093303.1 tyrosine-type recombinase/integrase [Microcoleus sp. FACHB-1515]